MPQFQEPRQSSGRLQVSDENNELIDPGPKRDSIKKKIDELFEFNQKVVAVLRAQAHDFEQIGGFYDVMKQRAFSIASEITELGLIASTNTSNILIAEFGSSEDYDLIDLSGEGPQNEEEEEDNE